ncbi:MAG: hypothetical protein AAF322_02400 [Pseudomonadota bacterium]
MAALQEFFLNNFVLVAVAAVLLVIVADEALGLSRAIFGDDEDVVTREERDRRPAEDESPRPPEEGEGPTVDDLLDPPNER